MQDDHSDNRVGDRLKSDFASLGDSLRPRESVLKRVLQESVTNSKAERFDTTKGHRYAGLFSLGSRVAISSAVLLIVFIGVRLSVTKDGDMGIEITALEVEASEIGDTIEGEYADDVIDTEVALALLELEATDVDTATDDVTY